MKKLLFLMLICTGLVLGAGEVIGTPPSIRIITILIILIGLYGAFWYFRNVWFFRDPQRSAPVSKNILVSPADGRVIYIRKLEKNKVVSNKSGENIEIHEITHNKGINIEKGWLIGIYMTPFDVHFNYSPISGKIEEITHIQTGLNLPMVDLWEYIDFTLLRRAVNLFSRKFHFINERMSFCIQGEAFPIYAILIADKFVNKIEKFVDKGLEVETSQKIAFIARGSQVDLFIPKEDIKITTEVGKQVYGGKSIIARY